MTLPASLAFYLDHASEVDELREIGKPTGVSPEDWSKFEDVDAWTRGHVEALLIKARAGAREALSSKAPSTAGKQRDIGEEWFAYMELKPRSTTAIEGRLWAGASLGVDAERAVLVLAPYLALGKIEQREGLVARLLAAGFSESAAAADSVDTVNLRAIPIGKDTDLDAAIAESTACFRLLAERWDKVFGRG